MAPRITLPAFAYLKRGLPAGLHRYLDVFPGANHSPGLRRIEPDDAKRAALLRDAKLVIHASAGFAYVDVETPAIVLGEGYYQTGSDLDLYLDMLHELTHIRQHDEGRDLWDERYAYVDRPTEIEGYAVAVEEGRRLGMTDADVTEHLTNPWMDDEDVARLERSIQEFLKSKPPVA